MKSPRFIGNIISAGKKNSQEAQSGGLRMGLRVLDKAAQDRGG